MKYFHTKKQQEYKTKVRNMLDDMFEGKITNCLSYPKESEALFRVLNMIVRLRFPSLLNHLSDDERSKLIKGESK